MQKGLVYENQVDGVENLLQGCENVRKKERESNAIDYLNLLDELRLLQQDDLLDLMEDDVQIIFDYHGANVLKFTIVVKSVDVASKKVLQWPHVIEIAVLED